MPGGLREQLRQGRVIIHNWHRLDWETEEQVKKRRTVDKRGARSLEVLTREVLGEPKTRIEALREREAEFGMSWPDILRIDRTFRPRLTLDFAKVKPLPLNATDTALRAELAAVVEGSRTSRSCLKSTSKSWAGGSVCKRSSLKSRRRFSTKSGRRGAGQSTSSSGR